jgi:hypothetical protein
MHLVPAFFFLPPFPCVIALGFNGGASVADGVASLGAVAGDAFVAPVDDVAVVDVAFVLISLLPAFAFVRAAFGCVGWVQGLRRCVFSGVHLCCQPWLVEE